MKAPTHMRAPCFMGAEKACNRSRGADILATVRNTRKTFTAKASSKAPRNVRKGRRLPTLASIYRKVRIMRRVVVMLMACVCAYSVHRMGPSVAMSVSGTHVAIPLLACACVLAGMWVCAGVGRGRR